MRLALPALFGSLVVVACSTGEPATPSIQKQDTGSASAITFHRDVQPILQKVCQNCHVPGGIAPFSLVAYEDAKGVAADIVAQTSTRRMPPWGAQDTSECKPPLPWRNDLRLSDDEIATLKAWHAGGDVEGDPATAPPPRVDPPTLGIDGAKSLAPDVPFDLEGAKDSFQCFVLDPALATSTYLDATFFVPKNKTIVHHALAFAIPPNANVPASRYECFGGPKIAGASLIAAWAPGGVPSEYPPGVALPVAAGTKFVIQVHYHPHANATPDPDATAFQYRTTTTEPTYVALPRLVGNFTKPISPAGDGLEPGADDPATGPAFVIPPDVAAHVETMRFEVPAPFAAKGPMWMLGVGAHMHLAGKDEKISLTRADGSQTCLLHEPAWDFNWQRGYLFDAEIDALPPVTPGDVIEMRCTYDNTSGNVALANAMRENGVTSPRPITLGETTADEMCLGSFVFVTKNPAK